jgi:hypothetical protein
MMEAARQLQYDKSKSVAKLAKETFQMLQHVNARSSIFTSKPLPNSSAASALFTSPPLSTPSPPLAELSAWPSEPPRACTEVERRTSFQEALCLFSEVAGLSDNTIDLPAPLAAVPAPASAALSSLPSLLRRPRPRVSPPAMLSRPTQFLPLQSPPKSLPQSLVHSSFPATASHDLAQEDFARYEAAAADDQPGPLPVNSGISDASGSNSGPPVEETVHGPPVEETVHDAECFKPLSRAPESPVLAAVHSSPVDELPPIPHDWSGCARDSTSALLDDDVQRADDGAAWRSEFTDAEVADMLREVEHGLFSPIAAPAHIADNDALQLPVPELSLGNPSSAPSAAPPSTDSQRDLRVGRALRVGVALGGAAVVAAVSVMWCAWHASDFKNIV